VAFLPVFLVEIPAMTDYPNHLTRMYLLAANGTPEENPYYTVAWTFASNLAMDVIVAAMAQLISVAVATKVFLVLSQLLVVGGSVALEIAVKQRHEFAGFVAVMALYCVPFALGFLPFEFGLGLALWGIASWFALEHRPLYFRLVVHSLFTFFIFVSHYVAFGLYGITIGFYELYCIRARQFTATQTILILVVLALPTTVLFGYLSGSGAQTTDIIVAWDAADKLRSILYLFNGYNVVISASHFIILFMLMYFLFRSRSLKLMPQGKWIAVGLLLVFLAVPFQGVFAEARVLIAAILIMPAFLLSCPTRPGIRVLLPLVFSIIILFNAGHIAAIWIAYQPEYAGVKSSFLLMKRGAFVLVGLSSGGGLLDDERPIYHAPVLAAHYIKGFVPSLFTISGQYALQGRPEFKSFNNEPVPISILEDILTSRGLATVPSHVRCWTVDYDYLYLIGLQMLNPMPSRLTELARGKRFTLYRIKVFPEEEVSRTVDRSRILLGNTTGSCLPRLWVD
jgi:hypothetical protein